MTDRDPFLAAVLENPADDSPRLAYADWLDEHDGCYRAEFIRVQCELALTKPDDGNETGVGCLYEPPCRWHKLKQREWWLLGRSEAIGTDKRLLPFFGDAKFARGFIEKVTAIRLRDWGAHAPAMLGGCPLARVETTDGLVWTVHHLPDAPYGFWRLRVTDGVRVSENAYWSRDNMVERVGHDIQVMAAILAGHRPVETFAGGGEVLGFPVRTQTNTDSAFGPDDYRRLMQGEFGMTTPPTTEADLARELRLLAIRRTEQVHGRAWQPPVNFGTTD